MQEFIYNNIVLCIVLPALVISAIGTIFTSYLSYKETKHLYSSVANMTFWEYIIEWDYIYLRWSFNVIILLAIFGTIEMCIYTNYEFTLIEQHKNAPCPQCQYKKYEDIWYDKKGIEHKEIQLIWQRCPTIKL